MLPWLKAKARRDGYFPPPHDHRQNPPHGQGYQQQQEEAAFHPNDHPINQENPDNQQAVAGKPATAIQEDFHFHTPQDQELHDTASLSPNLELHPFYQDQEHHDAATLVQVNLDEDVNTGPELGIRKQRSQITKMGSFDNHHHLGEKAKVDLKRLNSEGQGHPAAEDDKHGNEGGYDSDVSFNEWLRRTSTDPKRHPDDDFDEEDSASLDLTLRLGNARDTPKTLILFK